MKKYGNCLKRIMCIIIVFLLYLESIATSLADNDGSAFITKAEFDSLKSNFQSQIDQYNTGIDSKIDAAIAAYLAGISVSREVEIDNLYNILQSEVAGSSILWSSATTCNYNKAEYTNLGYKLNIRESINRNYDSTYGYSYYYKGINHSGLVFDYPVPNIVTYGGAYLKTDSKATIDVVGEEICFHKYSNRDLSNYAGYYPQSQSDGAYVTIGNKVKSIGDGIHLATTFITYMMWIYDVDCHVITSNSPIYKLEPANSQSIYTFDDKPGYKTFTWPTAFVTGSTNVRSGLESGATTYSSDASINDAWKDLSPNKRQNKHYGTNDFDYTNNNARMYGWGRTEGHYSWIDTTNYANTTTVTTLNTSYHPGAVYFKNYGEHSAVNELLLHEPKEKYGIYCKVKEGFPVLKAIGKGACNFKVKANTAGTLKVYNLGTAETTHTATLVTTKTLASGTTYQISADTNIDEVISVVFLPTSTTTNGILTITDTKEILEQ